MIRLIKIFNEKFKINNNNLNNLNVNNYLS